MQGILKCYLLFPFLPLGSLKSLLNKYYWNFFIAVTRYMTKTLKKASCYLGSEFEYIVHLGGKGLMTSIWSSAVRKQCEISAGAEPTFSLLFSVGSHHIACAAYI